jgi:MYXO-CTERM domain-containing protein
MKSIHRVLLAVCATGCVVSAAQANLITYEGFSGLTGPLHGTSTATSTGWKNSWDAQGGSDSPGYKYDSASPLSYPLLQSTSEYGAGGNAFQSAGREVLANFGSAWDTAGNVSSPFDLQRLDQGKVWMSALMRKNSSNNSPNVLALHQSNIPWLVNGSPRLEVGYISDEFSPGISDVGGQRVVAIKYVGTANAQAVTSSPIVIGETFLVVLGLDFTANVVDLYVNPASLGGAAPAVPTASIAMDAEFGLRSIGWYPGRDPGMGDLDEMRLGTTYASVTPVIPEPAGLGLLAVGGAVLARRRR